ncbi:hypothetical protein [Clavibacter sp. MX14-G9D]|uniref:hypothetical protein n=1 Tax=Clavibacter sp. MX14-G9D TaxID=3064656 RepID=UPI00293EF355|nr:hypothetical protein [Clavibacter sp. MX14-G9D]
MPATLSILMPTNCPSSSWMVTSTDSYRRKPVAAGRMPIRLSLASEMLSVVRSRVKPISPRTNGPTGASAKRMVRASDSVTGSSVSSSTCVTSTRAVLAPSVRSPKPAENDHVPSAATKP